ncbi:MAG: YfhO family protein, partial [Hyphomicrobiaceae bacterium]|nr:YfhO family protein [Hyphomicrobiaceae bacterium]
ASLHPTSLLSMAVPNVFGSLNMMNLGYWGPQAAITPDVAATDDSFNYLFVGAVPVAVLLVLGICRGGLLRQGARTWMAILVLALLFSLGRYTPLFPFVFEHVPGFSYFRRPVDGLFIVGLAIAVLAGHLSNTYVRQGPANFNRGAAIIVAVAAIGLLISGVGLAQFTGHGFATTIEIAGALPLWFATTMLLSWQRADSRRSMALVVLALIAAAQLLVHNAASRLNGEPSAIYSALEGAPGDEQAALDLLQGELVRRHREGSRPRVEIIGMGGAWQNLAMVHGLEVTTGYNPLRIGLYDRLVVPGESPANAADRKFSRTFSGYDCPLARALGLEYLVIGRPMAEIEQWVRHGRADVLLAGPTVWIYRFGTAMPRVKFHSRIEVADADALTKGGQLLHPPDGDRAILDDETPPSGRIWRMAAAARDGEARLASWRADRIEIEVSAPTAGVLVVHDTYYPGWTARVDGLPAPILRADTLFRGVEIPAGTHRVVMTFEPLSVSNLLTAARGLLGSRQDASETYGSGQPTR